LQIFEELIGTLPEGRILSVTIGLFWTAVVAEVGGERRCGLAATFANSEFEHARQPAVEEPGLLENRSSPEITRLVFSRSHTETAVGLAAINALLPPIRDVVDLTAEDFISREGAHQRVAVIGHFPFVHRLKDRVKELWVLELNPREGDLPASAAPEIIPRADILAITATTLINHTFEGIMACRKPHTKVMLLGPSTPLSPTLFEHGIDVLSGSIVTDPGAVLPLIRQGATFRQIRGHGVRLVTLESPPK